MNDNHTLKALQIKKATIEALFNSLKQQRDQTQLALNNLDQELFRLQGAARAIDELIAEFTKETSNNLN